MRLRLVANVRREQLKLDGLLANVCERFPLLNAGLVSVEPPVAHSVTNRTSEKTVAGSIPGSTFFFSRISLTLSFSTFDFTSIEQQVLTT